MESKKYPQTQMLSPKSLKEKSRWTEIPLQHGREQEVSQGKERQTNSNKHNNMTPASQNNIYV